jgi:hypothetical protein
MSALTKTLPPDEKIKAGKLGSNMVKAGLALAVVFAIISLILGSLHGDNFKRFFYALVTAWSWAFGVAAGMLWIILLHHLCRGRWITAVRRISEAISQAMPILFLAGLGFIVPLLAGYKDLYYWNHPDAHNAVLNPHIQHKLTLWLTPWFFALRYGIYAVVFTWMANYFARASRKQDETGDPALSTQMRVVSGPAMIVYSFAMCLLAWDIQMSLALKWYSTIYGVSFWASGNISAFAVFGIVVLWIQRSGRLVNVVTHEHYHDIGKWMFSFTFFWAYTCFSEFMLQWYGNMPEETNYWKYRMFGDWQWVSIAILVGYWAFPFVFLMSRWTKRIVPALVFFSVWQLAFTWLQNYWRVMPQYDWEMTFHESTRLNAGPLMGSIAHHTVGLSAVDFTVWIAMIGILLVGIGRSLKGNLIPTKDPTLGMSLAHEVM